MDPLEPVPAAAEALELMGPAADRIRGYLDLMTTEVRSVVPALVGIGLSMLDKDDTLTFTLAISEDALRGLDAVQYLQDGPCVTAVREDRVISVDRPDPLDEEHWSLYGRASAACGVGSSLSVPVHLEGKVVGVLNLYAAGPAAFAGHVEAIAEMVAASADEVMRDADLRFTARDRAVETLRQLQGRATIDDAAALLARREGITESSAAARIVVAARRAGVPAAALASLVLETSGGA